MTGQSASWGPGADIARIRLRAEVVRDLRQWFLDCGVLEVDTPMLSPSATTDPNLHSYSTGTSGDTWWLHTSPEFPMKRLLAAGSGDIYQLCHVFRDGEVGTRHNPEFTMLEWYRLGLSMHAMMDDVESLLRALCAGRRTVGTSLRLSYQEVFVRSAGIDPFLADAGVLSAALESKGIDVPGGLGEDREGLLDLLLSTVVEPSLDADRPVFIYDFPPWQAGLARLRSGEPVVAERFELFLGGMELANGFRELADPREQRARFEQDLARRAAAGMASPPMDERLLEALEAGLPDCSGVAMGLDRLLMFLAGVDTIGEVLAFDVSRA
jgi:lysyl-tRNA synthetase class 2